MNKEQAQQIIKDTFEGSFDKERFTNFIKNLLNRIEDAPFIYQGNYIPDAYKQYIKTLERIGKFSDGENNMDILVVTLQKETSLERARTMQRNFIAWYLNGSRGGERKDTALVAFVAPYKEDWRFSLVKMDYKFEQLKSDRMKAKEEFTPARRWSFLVGTSEKSHTAQSRLVNILANDEQAPILKEIENAFDIETVTKEFFLKYRELFLRTKEELDRILNKDPKIKADFEAKGVDTVNFAKKLLGQIIFLYFLQKKGWFGVGRDNDWGTGSKHFLRELFNKRHRNNENFFNDILEPLFYEALRIDRSHDDGYYSRFDCKIPFLNGGLFDPIGNYDWVHTDINLPDKLFSNTRKTKEDDIGDGILDIFDRYNFTVKEDEPLEKEVAIDPELLGKAYEKFNAIRPDNFEEYKNTLKSGKKGEENKFNKKFGVYYTPREIVHYMCQQSLINYLATELDGKASKEDIETLIHIGEQVSENEARVLRKGKETGTYSYKIPESIRNNTTLIDQKLADITVCDPAVGSGAFPVGMMSEIVKTRNVLSIFLNDKNRKTYNFKRRCIEHSLYGVDIDAGAVEIAKLRLWLSLIVDEDDIKNIKPLPNLDYRIMQGNSLISEFMGINFDTEKEKNNDNLMFKDETDELIEHFQQKKNEFLNESNVIKKTKLKEEVEDLLVKIFENKLKKQKAGYFNRLKEIENKHSNWPKEEQRKKYIKQDKEKLYKESGFNLESVEKQLKEFTSGNKIKPFFLWDLYFSEVFHNKSGFDVVIANPPYLESRHPNFSKKLKDVYQASAKRRWEDDSKYITRGSDLLIYFFENAIFNVHQNGCIVFITQNSWLDTEYGKKFQSFLLKNTQVRMVVDSDFRYFASGDGPNINAVITLFVGKESKQSNIVTFSRYHKSFERIIIFGEINPSIVDSHTYAYSDNRLRELKWGILLSCSNEILVLLDLLNQKAKKIDNIKGVGLSFGQGLNLSKDYFVNHHILSLLPFAKKAAIPFLTSEDGAIFNIIKTAQYILDKTRLSKQELEKIKIQQIKVFDPNTTSKRPPKLMMPRGISKHFCALNSINCYSSSFVDIYDTYGNVSEDIILNLWLFFNSSIFWLLREISGRKNLGGGMLKAEAIDLKTIPVYIDFQKAKEIKNILQRISIRKSLITIDEIETDEHKQIDKMVFDYLGLKGSERKNVVTTLIQKIIAREKKSST